MRLVRQEINRNRLARREATRTDCDDSHILATGETATFSVPAMSAGHFTRAVLKVLDWFAEHTLAHEQTLERHRIGRRGEEDAYFHLRQQGYVMVARNFRSPNSRGEIDLIGWEKDVLCFIEVKTRTTHDVKPAEAAVDRDKQRALIRVARDYLRHLALPCQWRFDVVTVYYEGKPSQPRFELFQNAFPLQ